MKTLTPYRQPSLDVFEQMRAEMDTMARRFFGVPMVLGFGNGEANVWAPHVDVAESEQAITVTADLPGVDPKNVEITVHEGHLTLRGERKEEKEVTEKNFLRSERFVGEFLRTIPIPKGIDEGSIKASTQKGVLTVVIPKKPDAMPRKVTIQSAD